MFAKLKILFLSKFFAQRAFRRVSNLHYLNRGYRATLKNSGCIEIAKQALCKTRILSLREVITKNEAALSIDKKKNTSILNILWEIVLLTLRVIVITVVVFALLTFYWLNKFFGLKTLPIVYLKALEFLGPTFTKLGQWMSTRRDLYPEEFCSCLSRLQRNTSAHSWFYTNHVLETTYGPEWHRLFVKIDRVPIGSGCCAQVYRALLDVNYCNSYDYVKQRSQTSAFVEVAEHFHFGHIADNLGRILRVGIEKTIVSVSPGDVRPVAIKILHPCVKDRLKRDLFILRLLSKCVTCFVPSLEWLNVTDCIDEFSQIMENQVNLEIEADNLVKFSQHFATRPDVQFPQPFRNLSCNQILVESFHEGRPIDEYVHEKDCVLRQQLAKIGLKAVFKMIFEDNFVHCDLHPGNILVQERPDGEPLESSISTSLRIVILDCGLVTELSESCRRNFREVFRFVVAGDGKRAADLMMNHSAHKSPDPVGFMETMDKIVKNHLRRGVKLENINVGHVMSELFSAMVRYQVKQDGSFSSVILGMAVIEGLGRSLDPNIDLIRELSPFLFSAKLGDF